MSLSLPLTEEEEEEGEEEEEEEGGGGGGGGGGEEEKKKKEEKNKKEKKYLNIVKFSLALTVTTLDQVLLSVFCRSLCILSMGENHVLNIQIEPQMLAFKDGAATP